MKINKILIGLIIIGISVLTAYSVGRSAENTVIKGNYINSESSTSVISSDEYKSPISIEYLRSKEFRGSEIKIEETLTPGSNYKRYIASYISDGNKIFGLLTIPNTADEKNKVPAIVFNHGYIPPKQYRTTEKYVAYVDYLAKNGFVVFKIDFRGHGNSEGIAGGAYFSNGYTIDAINAVKSLQKLEAVNANSIGMWGHSMSGNVTLRAMLVSPDIKAGVIWAGAVYSYEDFAKYGISDNSYQRSPNQNRERENDPGRESSEAIQNFRNPETPVNFNTPFWNSISMTSNLRYLNSPLEIHHSVNDNVVNIGYSRDLRDRMLKENKEVELFEYSGGGHNINSPYFEQAMRRTVDFFNKNLK